MANRYREAINIPHLRQKLWLLYQLGVGIEDDAALGRLFSTTAEPLGVSAKAIRYWVIGDGSREANMVPADRFYRFVEIFQKHLPGRRTVAETRALLTSLRTSDLQDAFMAGAPRINWISLVLGAQPGDIQVITHGRRAVFGVTARRKPLEPIVGQIEVPIGYWFQFKVPPDRHGWLTLIQWGQSGWFGLEVADAGVYIERPEAEPVLLPAVRPYFFEEEPGMRRFVFLQSAVPLPPDVTSKLTVSAKGRVPLDVAVLDRLAQLAGQSEFRIVALDVIFVTPSGTR